MGKIRGTFAKDYDSFIKRPGLLPEGLLELVHRMGGRRIADFACGTGNVAVGLSLEGFDVTGVDYSPDMLKVARAKARQYKAAAKFISGDITKVNLRRQFDLLLCLGNAIPQFTSNRKLGWLLANCKSHLHEGGHLIFQQLNYDRLLKEGSGTFAVDINGLAVRFRQNIFQGGKAGFFVTIVDGRRIPPKISTSKRTLKPWLRLELIAALKKTGFSGIKAIGNYAGERFGPKSKDLILVGTL
jgi:2-polyprenyl-3-methyl-5-hydroxy-6-metoxy-1,4-benzoquinol methylase